jgi:hypothetical protein
MMPEIEQTQCKHLIEHLKVMLMKRELKKLDLMTSLAHPVHERFHDVG